MKENTLFIPLLSTEAGSSLTMENWQDAGIDTFAFQLSDLIIKPGIQHLKQINLHTYTGYQGRLILVVNLPPLKKQYYEWYSPYDGSCLRLDKEAILDLIQSIDADDIVFQTETLMASFHSCFYYDEKGSFDEFLMQVKATENQSYLLGSFGLDELNALLDMSNKPRIISDKPAKDALDGLLYTKHGIIDVKEDFQKNIHTIIDEICSCQTCQNQLTIAYLHHLYFNCPLLCHRYLIQHNVRYVVAESRTQS